MTGRPSPRTPTSGNGRRATKSTITTAVGPALDGARAGVVGEQPLPARDVAGEREDEVGRGGDVDARSCCASAALRRRRRPALRARVAPRSAGRPSARRASSARCRRAAASRREPGARVGRAVDLVAQRRRRRSGRGRRSGSRASGPRRRRPDPVNSRSETSASSMISPVVAGLLGQLAQDGRRRASRRTRGRHRAASRPRPA